MAMLPMIVYRRRGDGGKERASNHPLYDVLHDRPNEWQTSFEWREMMQGHMELRGNAYSEILPGPRGAVDQLIPRHPDRITPEQLSTGRIIYHYREPLGGERIIPQEGMFHLRGFSQGGLVGMSPIEAQRETLGKALAAQDYGARFLANDATPGGVLEHPAVLDNDVARRIKKSWQQSQGGRNRGKVALLEDGMKFHQIGISNKDAQYLETIEATALDIASMYRVPQHKINRLGRATWNNIESQSIDWVVDGVLPRARRWEAAIGRDLILRPDIYYAEFLLDALLRGDIKSRYEAYQIAFMNGWMNDNEIRAAENMNARQGGDVYYVPSNLMRADAPITAPGAGAGNAALAAQLRALLEGAASRVIRKEVGALRRAAKAEGFREFASNFYKDHAAFVASVMRISGVEAGNYCAARDWECRASFAAGQLEDTLLGWETDGPAELVARALKD